MAQHRSDIASFLRHVSSGQMMKAQASGRVYQVRDCLNDLAALLKAGQLTAQGDRLVRQIRAIIARGYRQVAVVAHQPMLAHMRHLPVALGHFYDDQAPAFVGCDCLVVAGTPMLPLDRLQRMAAMVFFERDEPFDTTWSVRDVSYRGHVHTAPTPGFWHDRDLQAVLQQTREAEIARAAYRARPFNTLVDIWLLSSIPTELPVTDLLTSDDVLGTPTRARHYSDCRS